MDDIERMMRQALTSHGLDPDDPELAKEIRSVLGILWTVPTTPMCPLCNTPPRMTISNISMCGNMECTVLYWDNTMDLDELLLTSRLVSLEPIDKSDD